MDGVNPDVVSRLMTQNLPVIETIIEQLLALSELQQRLNDPGPEYYALIRRLHFTVTQKHQLKSIIRKWRALHPGDKGLADRLLRKKTATEILRFMQDELDTAPIRFN